MRRSLTAAAATAAAAVLFAAPAAAFAAPPGLHDSDALPAPTGPFTVGVHDVHLVDETRPDIWVPGRDRELMASVWYPAIGPSDRLDPYATDAEAELIASILHPDAEAAEIAAVDTHAYVDAPILPTRRGLPTVVLSPGFSMVRASLTGLAEDLAGRGYLVIGVDHTYEAAAVTFPDGRITTCLACTADPDGTMVAANRALDLSFVLDELSRTWPVDPGRVAVGGHSMGGAAAALAVAGDPRFRAGFNLDGTFHPKAPETEIAAPFLMIGNPRSHEPGGDGSWDAWWPAFTGERLWLTADGFAHSTFTDYGPLADVWDIEVPGDTIDGDRAMDVTRSYVRAFLDEQLRGRCRPLLDGPSARFPEVHFQG